MTGTLAFAFAAGMLSTVNPCGFAMLPAFLAYYLGLDQASADTPGQSPGLARRTVNGLGTGALVSLGFAGVFTITGLLVAIGLRSIIGAVPWVAVIIGVLLAAIGIAMVAGRHVGLTLGTHRVTRTGRGPGAMLAFGAAYAVASLSCTLAVLLAVIAQALAANSITTLVSVFAAYAAGAATILTLLALSAALASSALARGLRRVSRYLPRVAGAVLVASGAYLIAYWAPALSTGSANQSLARGANPLTSAVSDFVQGHTNQIGVATITAVLAALVAALWMRRQPSSVRNDHPHAPSPEQGEQDCYTPVTTRKKQCRPWRPTNRSKKQTKAGASAAKTTADQSGVQHRFIRPLTSSPVRPVRVVPDASPKRGPLLPAQAADPGSRLRPSPDPRSSPGSAVHILGRSRSSVELPAEERPPIIPRGKRPPKEP